MVLLSKKYVICISAVLMARFVSGFHNDNQCVPRHFPNRSTVCVCNATYCDTITREEPIKGHYVAYTSSQSGLRFRKTMFYMQHYILHSYCLYTLEVHPSNTYQTVEGFGGTATDSAAITWDSLKDSVLKQNLIDSYFSNKGIEYNMLRVPIGGTDCSTHPYAYNEYPEDDFELKNFTLSSEDYDYKIPMIQACQEATMTDNHIIASVWSPPAWMKDSNHLTGYSRLKKESYQTYADYHVKFIEKYKEQNISIWGVTTTNKPMNGLMNLGHYNSLGWSIKGMGQWIKANLGPTMRKHFPDIKIIAGDDVVYTLPIWFNLVFAAYPEAIKYVDGAAIHYTPNFAPASMLTLAMAPYPDKFLISSQAIEGIKAEQRVDLGSWERATNYAVNILEDLNENATAWIDLNLCLNMKGGPNWVKNNADSAVIVNSEQGEFYKQPMFYIIGHFSKFVPRGSKRILVTEKLNCDDSPLLHVGFLTPADTIVVILFNSGPERAVSLKLYNQQAVILAEAESITTLEFPHERISPKSPQPNPTQ